MNDMDNVEIGMVSVLCTVYNHGKYLRDTLDGFVNQQVDFKYEILIHDDASTDDSVDIIREYCDKYPDIFRPIFQSENQYSKGVKITSNLFKMARGEYIAICEGDDYWSDNMKLKVQYEYMEKHKECACVFHPVEYLANGVAFRDDKHGDDERDFSVKELIRGGGAFQATCSLFFRSRYVKKELPAFIRIADVGDYPLQLYLGLCGRVHYIPKIMAKYRWLNEGSWTQKVSKDKGRWLKHLRTLNMWMGAFNVYTTNKYKEDVAYIITWMTMDAYLAGDYAATKWKEVVKDLSIYDSIGLKGALVKYKVKKYIKKSPKLFNALKRLKSKFI